MSNFFGFWSNIWNKSSSYNENAKWIETLERKYCSNTVSKNYQINLKTMVHPVGATNKMVLDQVKKQRKNVFVIWSDYRKAFNCVPHPWIIKAFKLTKVPNKILIAIWNIMDLWATKVNLSTNNTSIETNITGVLQYYTFTDVIYIIC